MSSTTIPTNPATVDHAVIHALRSLDLLSRYERAELQDLNSDLHELFRRCALAVLNVGAKHDNAQMVLDQYSDFQVNLIESERGISIELHHAPASAFVDGEIILGLREHLFSVLRDIIYVKNHILANGRFDLSQGEGITHAVFQILRNARVLVKGKQAGMVVCWGGHSISREEYLYSKTVGHALGLRRLNVCTGCGSGIMKGPMKGALLGHGKQRINKGRYLGISEPGIMAAEAPNPIVNELVIMPDIEKRLEAFLRVAHAIVIFPGGVGTAEELLFLLGVMLKPNNQLQRLPLILTGPASSRDYFDRLQAFLTGALGEDILDHVQIILDDPETVAQTVKNGVNHVFAHRKTADEAYYFNWALELALEEQQPFEPTHTNMANLNLQRDQPIHQLAANLRRAFSGIVAGNVKAEGIREIQQHGKFQLNGDPAIMALLDDLLNSFVAEKRMTLPIREYVPCYEIVT